MVGRKPAPEARVRGRLYKVLGMALKGHLMARECHLQNPASSLIFQVSSSGGGLPGRLDLERDSRRSLFRADISQMDTPDLSCSLGSQVPGFCLNTCDPGSNPQLVEIVKLTVILASVSTGSLPSR